MDHGITLLAIVHICVALLLITFVLLQDSKGGTGGAFGGGSSQTLFGATGAVNFLVKVTRFLAIVFMCSCIGLAVLLGHRTGHSVTDNMSTLPPSIPALPPAANGVAPTTPGSAQAPAAAAGAATVPAKDSAHNAESAGGAPPLPPPPKK